MSAPLENQGSSSAYTLSAVAVLVLSSCAISRQDLPSWRKDSIRELETNTRGRPSRLPLFRAVVKPALTRPNRRLFSRLTGSRKSNVLINLAILSSFTDGAKQTDGVVENLRHKFPQDTLLNELWLPIILAEVNLRGGSPQKCVELLQPTTAYELGRTASFMPTYLRGNAYLQMQQGEKATAEFQKILDHTGVDVTSEFYALANVGIGRALTLEGNRSQSRRAYEEFFRLWKDADEDIPVLKQAKAEYRELLNTGN